MLILSEEGIVGESGSSCGYEGGNINLLGCFTLIAARYIFFGNAK